MAELSTTEKNAAATTGSSCCAPEAQATCCELSAKADCCGDDHGEGCGCDLRATSQPAGDARAPR